MDEKTHKIPLVDVLTYHQKLPLSMLVLFMGDKQDISREGIS